MEYIEKQFPLEYVENDWDNFLSEKVNGERVRYFKYFRLIPCDDATEGCINAFKKLQILSSDVVKKIVDTNFGRTFFNISYKIVDGFEYRHYNGSDLGYTDNEEYVKNGKKVTVDKVTKIEHRNDSVILEFERDTSGGEFTTCDMPSIGFENARVDMIKLVGFE